MFLAADQYTSTTDAEEELFRRIVSEELFQSSLFWKPLFRRLGSEGESSDDKRTSGHPGLPDISSQAVANDSVKQ